MNLQGKEICRCGNPSGNFNGMTFNTGSNTVLDLWCADCGGAIEAPANIKVKVVRYEEE